MLTGACAPVHLCMLLRLSDIIPGYLNADRAPIYLLIVHLLSVAFSLAQLKSSRSPVTSSLGVGDAVSASPARPVSLVGASTILTRVSTNINCGRFRFRVCDDSSNSMASDHPQGRAWRGVGSHDGVCTLQGGGAWHIERIIAQQSTVQCTSARRREARAVCICVVPIPLTP